MSRRAFAAVAAVVLAVVAAWAFLAQREPGWSTGSAAALAAWQAGEEAMAKLYLAEAAKHYADALQHDPDFAMAKLFFLRHPSMAPGGAEQVKRIVDELRGLDLSALNRRERLLVSYFLAHVLALRALLGDGDAAAAIEWARRADDGLRYLDGTWHLKLWNRLLLAEMLERSGRRWEAAELRAEVAEVNPGFAAAPPFWLPGSQPFHRGGRNLPQSGG